MEEAVRLLQLVEICDHLKGRAVQINFVSDCTVRLDLKDRDRKYRRSRNAHFCPGLFKIDAGVSRLFPIRERTQLELRSKLSTFLIELI